RGARRPRHLPRLERIELHERTNARHRRRDERGALSSEPARCRFVVAYGPGPIRSKPNARCPMTLNVGSSSRWAAVRNTWSGDGSPEVAWRKPAAPRSIALPQV